MHVHNVKNLHVTLQGTVQVLNRSSDVRDTADSLNDEVSKCVATEQIDLLYLFEEAVVNKDLGVLKGFLQEVVI